MQQPGRRPKFFVFNVSLLTQFLTSKCNGKKKKREANVKAMLWLNTLHFALEHMMPKWLTIPAIIISWSASSCFFFSSFSASWSCFNILFTSLSSSVTSAKVLSASALVLVAFWAQNKQWLMNQMDSFPFSKIHSHSLICKHSNGVHFPSHHID